jgi:hypothetical protein
LQDDLGEEEQGVKVISKKSTMPEEEYLKTHLKEMDQVKRRWYLNAMKTWTRKDYDNYTSFYLWMMG